MHGARPCVAAHRDGVPSHFAHSLRYRAVQDSEWIAAAVAYAAFTLELCRQAGKRLLKGGARVSGNRFKLRCE